jgi:membrane protease YdiL (CAAX protease family)
MLLVSFAEELVFRGYVLNNLMQSVPKEAALFTSAILFAIFHSLNPNFNLIAFINIFIAGMLLGVNYIYTRNLWFAIFFHFTWNFFQGPILGFEVSGLSLPSLLDQNLRGSILLTGGEFGLEASWLTTFATSLMAIALFFLFQRKYESKVE